MQLELSEILSVTVATNYMYLRVVFALKVTVNRLCEVLIPICSRVYERKLRDSNYNEVISLIA